MTLRSPIVAMLWEHWRLTRVEAAWKLALGIVGSLAALVVFAAAAPDYAARGAGAMIALFLIAFINITGWWSIGSLNRVQPGFPFYHLYTRPVRTVVLVGVPMAYLAALPVASYLVSALLLRVTSGYPFPLVPVAAWIAVINLAHAAANWPIRNPFVKLPANLAVGVAWFLLAGHRLTKEEIPGWDWTRPMQWPAIFDFPLTDYALIAAIGLASFGRDGRRCGAAAPRRCASGQFLDARRRIPGVARQPVPVPVSHLVRDAGAGVVRPEVPCTARADDRSACSRS